MAQVLVTTVPFAAYNRIPTELLESANVPYLINPRGKKLKEQQLIEMIGETEVLIAGTEPISAAVMDAAPNLRLISRVGIGLDNVDLLAARNREIAVSFTPEAPAPAVAELTVGLMLSLLRGIHTANLGLHQGDWHRYMGRRIPEVTIGLIGVGRVGQRVLRRLASFGSPRVLVNDLNPIPNLVPELKIEWVGKEQIYSQSDVISLHVPLTPATRNLIQAEQLAIMNSEALLINTSRGGIVDETDLYEALVHGGLGGAAVDVFTIEPYSGPLARLNRCLLTCHMGSMSQDCRSRMEIEATEEAIRFLNGNELSRPVPESEYLIQQG